MTEKKDKSIKPIAMVASGDPKKTMPLAVDLAGWIADHTGEGLEIVNRDGETVSRVWPTPEASRKIFGIPSSRWEQIFGNKTNIAHD